MKQDMLVIVPTRGRPDNIQRLIEAWIATEAHAGLAICIDDDDECKDAYIDVLREYTMHPVTDRVFLNIGPSKRLGPWLNFLAPIAAKEWSIIGFMGDDHLPRTPHWDSAIYSALMADAAVGIAYGNDLFRGPDLPTAAFLTSNIIETLGYMVPADLTHLYIDDAWRELGRAGQCLVYCDDVIIEHMHPAAGKADGDEGYARVNSVEMYTTDGDKFKLWTSSIPGLLTDGAKIRALKAST